MRIDWRPSGGRGEYELAGQAEGHSASDLLEWTIHLDLGPLGWRQTELLVSDQGGKPRLRAAGTPHHIQRQVASALLLPRSRRSSDNLAAGQPVMVDRRYLIIFITLSDVTLDSNAEVVKARPQVITVTNANSTEDIDALARCEQVRFLHDHIEGFPGSVSDLLTTHRDLLNSSAVILPDVERTQVQLIEALALEQFVPYVGRTDPVPALISFSRHSPLTVLPPDVASQDEPSLRLSATRTMRLTLQRQSSASRFRAAVMRAYDSTCTFCGVQLPSIKGQVAAGCQAAHILPYAEYDLDQVTNGLCLCPTHHWAFDQFLLAVDIVGESYVVRVTDRCIRLLPPDATAVLRQVAGPIPSNRLPKHLQDRPNPKFLRRLYDDNPTQ